MADVKKNNEIQVNIEDGIILKVKRELIEDAKTKAGDDMYAYVMREYFDVMGQKREFRVEFTVRSKDKKADYGGFDMLDIIFMVSDEAFLRVKDEVMVNTETGEKVWEMSMDSYTWSSPTAVYTDSGKAYIVICDSVGNLFLVGSINTWDGSKILHAN